MAADFSVPVSFAGYVSAAYTLAAVISGIGAFFWIGGVEKQRFLMLNVTLLGVTTLLIATTQQFYWLLALRLLAGLLGGTTMGVGIGLLLNAAPAALHGRMLATVIASFSLVSIVGMPGMLYLCEVASWRVALAAIGGLCLLAAVLVALFVPRDAPQPQAAAPVTLDRRLLLFAAAAGLTQFSPMLLIPVLAPLLTQRLQVVDAHLSWLFFIGGVAGYLATVLAGRWLQRFGAVTLTVGATLLLLGSLWLVARGGDGRVSRGGLCAAGGDLFPEHALAGQSATRRLRRTANRPDTPERHGGLLALLHAAERRPHPAQFATSVMAVRAECRRRRTAQRLAAGAAVSARRLINHLTIHIGAINVAIVSQGHQHEPLLRRRGAVGVAQLLQRRDRRIEHHEIRLFADVEVADFVVQRQRAGTAQGGMIERFYGGEPVMLQLADLVRLTQRA
jgi:MFS family permease